MASDNPIGGSGAGVAPRPVLLASRLVRLLLALLLVRTAISLAQQDLLLGYYLGPMRIDPDSSEGQTLVEGSRRGSTSLTLLVLVSSALLLLPGATMLTRGATWVRAVTTVPCGIAALGLPLTFLFPGPWWYQYLAAANSVLSIVVLTLLYRWESAVFFRRTRRQPTSRGS
ncbi:MAG: hypothetical protein M3419_08410 [Actinomycetota bacterium]|nr:hypothetical protein [Actinomycetota bacterium]